MRIPGWAETRELATAGFTMAVIGATGAGCVLDADHRCGANEVLYGDYQRCVCVQGFVSTPHGCVPCASTERAVGDRCVCIDGYARPQGDAGACAPASTLGAACDSVTQPCIGTPYGYCQTTSSTSGYCTSTGCTGESDCPTGYGCEGTGASAVCRLGSPSSSCMVDGGCDP